MTTTNNIEAMKYAWEEINQATALDDESDEHLINAATALLKAISEAEQAEQKPVAWMHIPKYYIGDKVRPVVSIIKYDEPEVYAYTLPLYYQPTTPLQREVLIEDLNSLGLKPVEWVSLTVEQFCQMEFEQVVITEYADGTKIIKAKLKEKNT